MANTYQRLDLDTFKKKLAEGGYKDLTSVRKGVGRLRDWSKDDIAKAIKVAEKHFGTSVPAPASTKSAGKKTPKKAVKTKAGKPEKPVKEAAPKKAIRKVRQQQVDDGSMTSGVPLIERIHETNYQIEIFGKAIEHMAKNKVLGCPSNVVQEGAKAAQEGLIAAVNNLCVMTREAAQSLHDGNGSHRSREAWSKAVEASQNGQLAAPPPIPQRPFPPVPPQAEATDPAEDPEN